MLSFKAAALEVWVRTPWGVRRMRGRGLSSLGENLLVMTLS